MPEDVSKIINKLTLLFSRGRIQIALTESIINIINGKKIGLKIKMKVE
jgi:hypothetical protein